MPEKIKQVTLFENEKTKTFNIVKARAYFKFSKECTLFDLDFPPSKLDSQFFGLENIFIKK